MAKDYLLYNRYVSIRADTLVLDGLDATFALEKNMKGDPNKCELLVYNLAETNRKALQNLKNVVIEIRAGYSGLQKTVSKANAQSLNLGNLPSLMTKDDEFLIFKGDIVQIFSQKDGPDWVTTLRTADGITSQQQSQLTRTFKQGSFIKDIVTDLLRGVKVDAVAAIKKIQSGNIPGTLKSILNSYNVFGSVHKELEKHFKKLHVSGYIQDGELIILKKGETLGTEAVLLTPETGLIGSPEISQDGLLRCSSLIRPELILGHQLKIQSASISGTYRIERLVYTGSTFGNEWYVDIEATAL